MSDEKQLVQKAKSIPEQLEELKQGVMDIAESTIKMWQVVRTIEQRLVRIEGQLAIPDTVPPCPHCGSRPSIQVDGYISHKCDEVQFHSPLYDWAVAVQQALQGVETDDMKAVKR